MRNILHPERYHGFGRSSRYFEGWYYKVVDSSERHILAVIPGISLGDGAADPGGAFVQILDGISGRTCWFGFPREVFHAARRSFDVAIGSNTFSARHLCLDLADSGHRIHGELTFLNQVPWPRSLLSPGAMGPFSFVPFMECYHGVLSMDYDITGWLEVDGVRVDFTGGRGYLEKDWGTSFPQAWIWAQTNHFAAPRTSLMVSVARVPWLGGSFTGFIAGFLHDGKVHIFASYNGSRLEHLSVHSDRVDLRFVRGRLRLEVMLFRPGATAENQPLRSPVAGAMQGRVGESIRARASVGLWERRGSGWERVFAGDARHVGLEVMGDTGILK